MNSTRLIPVIAQALPPPLFNYLFHSSTSSSSSLGVQKIGFVKILQQRKRDFKGHASVRKMMGFVHPATEDYAPEAVEAIRAGKVIAVPTDTLYGFACDAWYGMLPALRRFSIFLSTLYSCSVEAVNRIYDIKGRKYTSPLAICVGDVRDIEHFAVTDHLPPGLLDCLLPGPVTVVLGRGESSILEKSLNPGLDTIGVRVPDCNFIRFISRGSQSALALTSANLCGQPSSVDIKDFENLWDHCA